MLNIMLRTVLLYAVVIAVIRFMGQRQIGQWSPFDFTLTLILAEIATTPMEDTETPILFGILPMAVLFALHETISFISLKSEKLRAWMNGKPIVIIKDGSINEKELARLRCTLNDLMEQLRLSGVGSINEVSEAVFENSGRISVFKTPEKRGVTPADLGIRPTDPHLPATVVLDGKLNRDNLEKAGRNEEWLREKLGGRSIKSVLLMTVDDNGGVYIAEKNDGGPA